jgi:SH3-like domain-containing protein
MAGEAERRAGPWARPGAEPGADGSRRGLLAAPATSRAEPELRAPRNRAAGETPSGLPVPRFVSMRKSVVYGRAGPSIDYDIVAIYRQQGLPVQVIAETEGWRRVLDSEGRRVWIARYMLSGRQTGVIIDPRQASVALLRRPDSDARTVAMLQPGVVVRVQDSQSGWRRVDAGRHRGWVPAAHVWGP